MKALAQRLAPFLFLSLFAALPASAQVTQFSAGAVEVRAFSGRTSTEVYAAAYGGGLFRSTDAGANWTRLNLPANDHYLTAVASNSGTTTRVAAGDEGLYTSTDGTSFTKRLFEPVTAVAMGPGVSTTVLAAVKGLGILRSTNSGVTWTLADNGDFAGTDIIALAEDPSNANIFYASAKPDGAGNKGGVYKTTDAGLNWVLTSAIPNAANRPHVFGLAVDTAGNVFASSQEEVGGSGAIYKLTGGAGAWAAQTNTYSSVSVHRDANTGTTIWAGHRALGLKRKAAADGQFFDQFPSNGADPSFFYTSINAVATLPGAATIALKAIKGAGVYRATNVPALANAGTGTTWTRVVFPNADRVLSASHVGGSASSMLLGLHAGGVWRSDTAGNAASTFNPPVVNGLVRADFSYFASAFGVSPFNSVWDISASPTNGGIIYVATGNVGMHYGNDNPGIFRYDGTKWTGIHNAAVGAPYNIVAETGTIALPTTGNPLFGVVYGVELNTGNDQVLYASFLGGTGVVQRNNGTWAALSVPASTRSTVSSQLNSGRVIALPFDDKPYIANASPFSQVSVSQTGFERLRFFQVAEHPSSAANWIGATNKGLYYSVDSGASWTRSSSTAFQQQAIAAVGYKPSGHAFAADRAGNRYCSADSGVSWTRLTTGTVTFNAGVNAIRVVNGQLFYLTDGAGALREDGSC